MKTGTAILMGASVIAGALLAWTFAHRTGESGASRPPDHTEQLREIAAELREIAALLRVEVAPANSAKPSGAETAGETGDSGSGEDVVREGPSADLGSPETAMAPAPRYEELRDLCGDSLSPERRREVLFTSEEDVLRRFGTPDRISLEAGGERWEYVDRSSRGVRRFWLILAGGRLVRWESN